MDVNPGSWGLYYILNKYCNLYLDGVKAENVKMALWSGSATINDFSLKTENMGFRDIPLKVIEASVGRADIQIPWKAWRTKAPEVTVKGIRLVVETTLERPETRENDQETKEKALDQFEKDTASLLSWVKSVLKGTNSFSFLTKSMLSNLLHNLKITVEDVTIELRHSSNTHEIKKFLFTAKLKRLTSYSTDPQEQEMLTVDSILHFRKAEILGISAISEFTTVDQPAFVHKSVVLSTVHLFVTMSYRHFDMVEFTTERGDVNINVMCTHIALRLSRTLIEILLQINQTMLVETGKTVITPRERFYRVVEKVRAQVRSRLLQTSLATVARKVFWKDVYIRGYRLRLNTALIPQNQIGFSHGQKMQEIYSDPRFISAAFYDLESLLPLNDILAYRREAVELHLMEETGLNEQALRAIEQPVVDRQGLKSNAEARVRQLVRANEGSKAVVQGQKEVWVKVRMQLSNISVELFTIIRNRDKQESASVRAKNKEESCFLFRSEDIVLTQTSVVSYSPLFTIHNRFVHMETLTDLTLGSLHLWLTAPISAFYAIRRPIIASPGPLTIKFKSSRLEQASASLKYLSKPDLAVHVKLEEVNLYIYPEIVTAANDYFSFLFSQETSKYEKEMAFFSTCKPTALFRPRSNINRKVKITCEQLLRVVIMTSFQNGCDAAIVELIHLDLKAEKWPSDTIGVEVNKIRAFALTMPRANADLLEVVRTVPRVLFTAAFRVKVLTSSYRSVCMKGKDKQAIRKELHKELNTPDYMLSVISQEMLIHLNGDQLKSLVSLAEAWTTQSQSSAVDTAYIPLKLNLTTKQMRRATHQVKHSVEVECRGAVISIVSQSGPYMKIIAHKFEVSRKVKCFESLVLVQCQGLEVLDTRKFQPGVLFAIGERKKGKRAELIHQEELDDSGFLVDRKNVLILTCRSAFPESEHYSNISSEVQLAVQSLHLTYNPRILADTLTLFQPILRPAQLQGREKPQEGIKEAKVINLKLVLEWGELFFNCIYLDKPLISLHTRNIISVIDLYAYKTQVRLHSEDLRCVDTSKGSDYNRLILGTVDQTSHLAVNYEAKSVPNCTETATLQVRIQHARLVYLNRVIMDILEYVNRFFVGKADPVQPVVEPMAMEILFVECEVELPRNSLETRCQTISIDKLSLRRNAPENSNFLPTSQFEYEVETEMHLKREESEVQVAKNRLTRLNQYPKREGELVPELYLSLEEINHLPPVLLKGLSVYYYKPEGVEAAEQDSKLISVLQTAEEVGRSEPAPDPTDSHFHLSKASLPVTSSSFNWQIEASNFRLFGVGQEEILCSSILRVYLFSSTCSKLEVQLEDDIIFCFTQQSFSFLLQTLMENMGELQTISPDMGDALQKGIEESSDLPYFQIVLLGNKVNFLFSKEGGDDGNAEIHDADLAQFIFNYLRIECSMLNSGAKSIQMELDGFMLRDQRPTSLLRYLCMGNEGFEPLLVYPNAQDSDIERANLAVEMQLHPSGLKEINMTLAECHVLLLPDLFTDLQVFFTSAFDPNVNPVPGYIQLPTVIPSAGMQFALSLESVNLLFPSSLDSLKSTLLVLHSHQTALSYKTTGDVYNGPGSARAKCLLQITHMYFSNFEEQQMENLNHTMLLLQAEVSLEYLRQKPSTNSSWVGEQVLVHVVDGERGRVGGTEESKWHFNLTISEVWKIMDICKCLSSSSLSQPSREQADNSHKEDIDPLNESQDSPLLQAPLPLKLSPDIPTRSTQHIRPGEELLNFSFSLAIDKLLITVLNKDIHPLLSFQSTTFGTYHSQGDLSSHCQVEVWLTVHYFNQRTTAWEPALEWCGWDLELASHNKHSKLTLSSDIGKLLLPTNINISYALIDLIGGLWKNWVQEREGTEFSSATPYNFYNYTGLPLGISTPADENGELWELEPTTPDERTISRQFVGRGKYLRFSSINRYKIDIIVNSRKTAIQRKGFSSSEEYRKVKSVPIDTSDVHVMPLIERGKAYDASSYKRSATKKVQTLKLKDKIESFFIQSEHDKEATEEPSGSQSQSRCFSCLPCIKKEEAEVEMEQANISLLVVEARWIQELGLKEILIRSSLTLRNELSTNVEVEMTPTSNAPVIEKVGPGKKLYIPLPVVNGNIKIRPNKTYDWSREITLSALSGIVKEQDLKRLDVVGEANLTESLVLGFVPLICNRVDGSMPFSCALETLKKKNNTIRKKVVKDERYMWVPDKRRMNMRRSNSGKGPATDLRDEHEDSEDDLGEEELIFQERELLLSSIISITNALPVTCVVDMSDEEIKEQREEGKSEEEVKSSEGKGEVSISQGQTYHLFFHKFYAKFFYMRLKLDGYNLSNNFKVRLGKIKEEKKFSTKLIAHNSNHKLFVHLAVSSDDFGCWRMTIYVPFWILNKTSFELLYAEPELFQAKREAKQASESEEKLKDSAARELFVEEEEEERYDGEAREASRMVVRTDKKRKSRMTANFVTCPFCQYKNDVSILILGNKTCKNCKKEISNDKNRKLAKSEQKVTCKDCQIVINVSAGDYSEGLKQGIECPNCKAYVYLGKKATFQPASDMEEVAVKRLAVSSPGAFIATHSKKSTSVISANKSADWFKFIVYSPSKMVSKLKVAMMDSEISVGRKAISKWSDTFSLGNAGTSGSLSFNLLSDMKIDLGVRIDRGKGVFHRTNIITFTPRYMLKCQNVKLVCRQVDTDRQFDITPDEFTIFNWTNRSMREIMTIALHNEFSSNLKWSGGFYIHEQGEFTITVQNDSRKTEDFILVSIVGVGPTQVVQFQPQKKDDSIPFILRNYTNYQVQYVQNVPGGRTDIKVRTIPECNRDGDKIIPSFHYYALDEETEKAEVTITIASMSKVYQLDSLGEMEPMDLKSGQGWQNTTRRKWGTLHQRRRFLGLYKTVYAEVSDGVLVRKKNEHDLNFKSISLIEECVKAVDYQDSVFFLDTCLKRYQFRASSPEDAQAWIQALMDGKEALGSLTSQLIHVDIMLEGATHVFSLRTGNSKDQKGRHMPGCKRLQEILENRKKLRSKEILFEFQFFVSSVNISIIDDGPQEVLLLNLKETQLEYYQYHNQYEGFQITINHIQLDNQIMQNYWPVIFAPFARKRRDLKTSVFVSFSKHSAAQLDHVHYLDIYLQPIELRLEGSVLNFLLRAFEKIYSTFVSGELQTKSKLKGKAQREDEVFRYSYTDSYEEVVELAETPAVPMSELAVPSSQKKLFIEELVIQPFWIVLSVNMNSPIDSPLPRKFLFSLASIGLAITSIEAAEINMEGLRMYDMYQLRSRFVERLIQHYYSKCVFQVYKILGAMEFLGNPANLLQSFKAGMKAALVKPVYTLMRDPKEFIPELLKGGFGMVTHTIHGVFTSASKLAGGIGRSLALLTMDSQFQRARRNLLNRKVSSIAGGLMAGLKHAGYGLFDGVTSIVTSPMQGYKQKGVEGLFTGIGKGIVGTVVKPVSGLFDAFSATTSTLGKYARAKFEVRFLERNRVPRHFHKDRILYPYDEALARAQFLLHRYNPVYRHEHVIFFSPLKNKEKHVLIVTKSHIFYMHEKPSSSDKGKKFNKETIQDIKFQNYTKSLHILFKDGKKLLIDCNSIEDKDKDNEGSKWKELTKVCMKFAREATMRVAEDEAGASEQA